MSEEKGDVTWYMEKKGRKHHGDINHSGLTGAAMCSNPKKCWCAPTFCGDLANGGGRGVLGGGGAPPPPPPDGATVLAALVVVEVSLS